MVRGRYGYVVNIRLCSKTWKLTDFWHSKSFTDKQRIIFFRQLAVILNSGIPLLQGIELLQRRLDKDLAQVCGRLQERLRAGSTLHNSMMQDREFFPTLAITLAAAGESSGELQRVMEAAADYYARQYELKCFLYKAAAYPVFLLAATGVVSLFFLLYVLPQMAAVYVSMRAEPDTFLQSVLWLNSFLSAHSLIVTGSLLGIAVTFKSRWHIIKKSMLRLPGVKNISGLVVEIRFCKLLALLLNSGLNITVAVEEAGRVFTDDWRLMQLYLFKQSLIRGIDIGTAAQRYTGIFSPLTAEFVAVGTATGCLPQMLTEAAMILEQDLQGRLERFRELFAPMLLLVAALFTALVVCSVMGPLFDLFTALPEYD